jgi:outer membrane protein assembly factor BamB
MMTSTNLHSAVRLSVLSSFRTILLALLSVTVATVLASAQVTSWPEFQFGNDRLGFNPYEEILGASNVNQLGVAWQAHPLGDVIYASPAVANGLLYDIGFTSGQLFALDASTGAIVWRQTLSGQFFQSSPTVVGNVLYIGVGFFSPYYTGAVYAINALTGQVLWSNGNVNAIQTAPTVGNGMVYVASDFGEIYALDAATGQVQWSYDTTIGSAGGSAGALANGVLYMGVGEFLFALNASDGALLWRQQTSYFIGSSPAVQNGVVYINSYDGGVYAFDAATGAAIWHRAIRILYFTSPSIAYGNIYLCGFDGAPGLTALDAQTGETVWFRSVVQCRYSSPTVANGVVYAGWESLGAINSHIVAFDANTGAQLWIERTDALIYSEPIVVNGKLYITTYSGEVTAFGLN